MLKPLWYQEEVRVLLMVQKNKQREEGLRDN